VVVEPRHAQLHLPLDVGARRRDTEPGQHRGDVVGQRGLGDQRGRRGAAGVQAAGVLPQPAHEHPGLAGRQRLDPGRLRSGLRAGQRDDLGMHQDVVVVPPRREYGPRLRRHRHVRPRP
jgi:hypothetical protein